MSGMSGVGSATGTPQLFDGPALRPRRRDAHGVTRLVLGGVELDQVKDLEAASAQQPDPVTEREVELDGGVMRAASAIHTCGSAQIAAPYSLITRSTDALASGTCSPAARTRGKPQPRLVLHALRDAQLAGCRIDPNRSRPGAKQPGRHVPGAAAELGHPPPGDVIREHPSRRLGDAVDAPTRLRVGPASAGQIEFAGRARRPVAHVRREVRKATHIGGG